MPTDPPAALSALQLKELLFDLRNLREELAQSLLNSADGAKPVDLDEPIGRISRIDAIQQQEIRKSGRRAAEHRLTLVQAALAKGAADGFGDCADCEEPIGFRRLKAKPESRLCLSCQSQRESR